MNFSYLACFVEAFIFSEHTGAVELRNAIGRALAVELPGTLVFDCPTAGDIVRYILNSFQLPAAGSTTSGAQLAAAAAGASSLAPSTTVRSSAGDFLLLGTSVCH
jgi:Phosphopantetheine attachment site